MMRRLSNLALLLAGMGLTAAAPYALPMEEPQIASVDPDAVLVNQTCAACHSLDYILTQPPHKGRAFWQAEVTKMVAAYGAPVSPEDATRIAAYLGDHR